MCNGAEGGGDHSGEVDKKLRMAPPEDRPPFFFPSLFRLATRDECCVAPRWICSVNREPQQLQIAENQIPF